MFYHHTATNILIILIYVDDILITGSHYSHIATIIRQLHQQFVLRDLGNIHYFLGVKVQRSGTSFLLSQATYIRDILSRLNLQHLKATPTLITTSISSQISDDLPFSNPPLYRSTIGSLHYVLLTRPDITFAINKLSQHSHVALMSHW